jgi:GT2 family glycosyltransferase
MSGLLAWTPLMAARGIWRDYRFHRVSLSSLAPVAHTTAVEQADLALQSNPDLRIAGGHHYGLICSGNSLLTFRTAVGPSARVRAYCAVMPSAWDRTLLPWDFQITVIGASSESAQITRSLNPGEKVEDRRWRSLRLTLPFGMSGAVNVTLKTRTSADPSASNAAAAWGDVSLEWPRSRNERRRLRMRALQLARWSGFRRAAAYAIGRQRLQDQAAAYTWWAADRELNDQALERLRLETTRFDHRPLISIITPVHNTPAPVLEACLASVRRQAYEQWQHCIADDASTTADTRSILRSLEGDPRVSVVRLEHNVNISGASNAALGLAKGEFVAFLDHDDELAPEALAEVARFIAVNPEVDVVYSDEDKLDERGQRCDPHFKPDWSPELFLSYMYSCHLMVIRRSCVEAVGGFRIGFEGAQDYDLLLRVIENTRRIAHIPRVLYHWRKSPTSTAAGETNKPWAVEAGVRALEDHAHRTAIAATILPGASPGMYRFRRVIRGEPLVSIVIPSTGWPAEADGGPLARCLHSLSKTDWSTYEVILAIDAPDVTAPVRAALRGLRHSIVSCTRQTPFNFSRRINEAVRRSSGEHIVLFNDDLEVVTPGWLTAMLEYSQEPEIGAVGAKLLYPDGRLQHVGMLIGVCGIAAHAFYRWPAHSPGYVGVAVVGRNCSAVTAACLMMRRTVFEEMGGLDEELPVDFNDVDLCLRLRAAGYRIVFTPYAELIHHESASFGRRLQRNEEYVRMRQRWGDSLDSDPYYNPNLSRNFSDYRLQS